MIYHVFYKTTNLIDEKYYYGIHSTDKINDNYLGSGVWLLRAIKKYGKENFKKEVLAVFDTREEAFFIEKSVVTRELIEDRNCYNITCGGKGNPNAYKIVQKRIENKKKEKHITNKLKGERRTEAQKMASIQHSSKRKGKPAFNKKEIVLFGVKYSSLTGALLGQGLSTSHYYFMKNNDIQFNTAEELKKYTWELRNSRIKKYYNSQQGG